ncbi:phosphoglycerol transferase MdoB-like AlkP superfamily enzyme [Paenibacillus taihuensis]|uniref:Phosphoglycerol transferase MdoB-like AlkP superfamily enzyme n=1 Tax=Paenibacillus taihuensis TaxID=1156355 RepID=A0A3D9RK39_9BACL|nr:LTA synthase family protein [Paenibacillus taihuensis]REE80250.1 phosphoglycerol transferase MdoB-like AlkP superfamily enzyme [Paenibacillus taihuensis]
MAVPFHYSRRRQAPFFLIALLQRLDFILFVAIMLLKLNLFDRIIHVPNMAMVRDDWMTAAGTLIVISFWTLWLPARGRLLALIILDVLLTAIVYADLIYFRYFQDLITVPVLMQAGQVGALGESIDSLLSPRDLWFFADWLLLLPLFIYTIIRARRNRTRSAELSFNKPRWMTIALRRLAASIIVFLIGFMLVYVPVHKAKQTWAAELFTGNWWNLSLYNVTGVLGFHGYDLYRYANEHWLHNSTVTAEQETEAKQWFQTRGEVRGQLESDALFGKYKGKNVIMIQLEAFQNFVINSSIGGVPITPNMNKLLESSLYFPNFYHQTAQGRTSDADLAANVSLQPLPTGSVFIRYAQHQYDSMPQTLRDNGYTAAAFHAYDGGFWNRNMMYDQLGYEKFYSKKDFTMNEPIGWSLGDKSFFQQSVQKMTQEKEPFYSFMISLSSHHPYKLPQSAQTLDTKQFKGTMFGDYLEAVHYVDASLGTMIDALKQAGLWDKSIFLFYGDHDNSISDWKPFESLLGQSLDETERFRILKGVPLIVHLPDDARAGTYEQPGGQLDITPTILHLLGIASSDKVMIGTPLITAAPPRADKKVVFRSGAYTDGSVLYLPAEDGLPEHSKCYSITGTGATGTKHAQLTDQSVCHTGAQEARKELEASDLVVEYNLVLQLH